MDKKKIALVLAISVLLGCGAKPAATIKTEEKTVTTAGIEKRHLADGLYDMVINSSGDALYVASSEGFKDVEGGVIYKLDPETLKTVAVTHTDLKNFALIMSPDNKTLYTTHTMDGGFSAISVEEGKVKERTLFPERNDKGPYKGRPYLARKILLHDDTLYIAAAADPALIWVVDARTLKLKTRIQNAGRLVTGLHYSELTQRLYAANGSGEILVINPASQSIERRWKPLGDKPAFLLNFAEDSATGRLFVTDNAKAKTTLVIDIRSGKLLQQLSVGDSLMVKFNPTRNEIYISRRLSGDVISLDGTSYVLKKRWDLPIHPNNLLLSPDGNTLYVTVKQPLNKDYSTNGPDSLVRIDLTYQAAKD